MSIRLVKTLSVKKQLWPDCSDWLTYDMIRYDDTVDLDQFFSIETGHSVSSTFSFSSDSTSSLTKSVQDQSVSQSLNERCPSVKWSALLFQIWAFLGLFLFILIFSKSVSECALPIG